MMDNKMTLIEFLNTNIDKSEAEEEYSGMFSGGYWKGRKDAFREVKAFLNDYELDGDAENDE